MSKVAFISQPMHGFTQEEVDSRRHEAIKHLTKQGYTVANPSGELITEDTVPADVTHPGLYALGFAINDLARSDVAYFLEGWRQYRGCEFEHSVCRQYGIPCIYEVRTHG